MISYLQGTIIETYDDRITLLVNGIGYDILIPSYAMNEIKREASADKIMKLHISYHQTERQPKPLLVGFKSSLEKRFFERFITVEDIGPTAAIKALVRPVREIARAIEEKDIGALRKLKGIGERKAEKIIATLKGKMAMYALLPEAGPIPETVEDFRKDVEDVLVTQLGHKQLEARRMIEEAVKSNPLIGSFEELFDEVYKGYRK